jgi:hypothetical protein
MAQGADQGSPLHVRKIRQEHRPGSGHVPGEDLAVASWVPLIKGLTPHGLRHGLKVWMDEDQIPDVLKSERLGHDEPGMRGVYGHVSPAMREELKAALQARWEDSLSQCAVLSPVSAVPLLSRLLADIQSVRIPARSRLVSKVGRQARARDHRASPSAERQMKIKWLEQQPSPPTVGETGGTSCLRNRGGGNSEQWGRRPHAPDH